MRNNFYFFNVEKMFILLKKMIFNNGCEKLVCGKGKKCLKLSLSLYIADDVIDLSCKL